jgi:hypothetical protein
MIQCYYLLQKETSTKPTLYWIALSVLNCSPWRSSKDHLLLIQCYYRRKPKLTLFLLDSSISSKLFSLEVQ